MLSKSLKWNFKEKKKKKMQKIQNNSAFWMFSQYHLNLVIRKPVLCHMRTTKAQIRLRIRAVPLLFPAKIV